MDDCAWNEIWNQSVYVLSNGSCLMSNIESLVSQLSLQSYSSSLIVLYEEY